MGTGPTQSASSYITMSKTSLVRKPILTFVVLFVSLLVCTLAGVGNTEKVKILKRSKRFLWLTHDRRLILPAGSTLVITPRLQIPFLRQPPEGLNSDIQISWPFYSK